MRTNTARRRPIESAEHSGEEVYSLHWMNEWGGGLVRVVCAGGRYHVFSSDDIEAGPYPTLQEALARGAGRFGRCEVDITCTALPAALLVEHLEGHEPGQVIRVNDS